MTNNFIQEKRNFINSPEYDLAMESVIRFNNLSEDQGGILAGRVNALLLEIIDEAQFIGELVSELEITEDKAKSIADRVKKEVIAPFKEKLATMPVSAAAPAAETPTPTPSLIETLRHSPSLPTSSAFTTHQSHPPLRVEEPMTKEHILSQIENPPRTVIKKYVIEHEPHPPVKDPEHLIDDPATHRAKLEAHYKN